MSEDNDPEADFWLHVGNAQNAIEDFNNFDPDGTETGRDKIFQITVDANEAAIDLIEYVVENKDKLLEKMKGDA